MVQVVKLLAGRPARDNATALSNLRSHRRPSPAGVRPQ
uniref:PER66 n=1 Tax=Arundo donax TaxID=35708 RepID=A0A0A9Q9A4_ARUDO